MSDHTNSPARYSAEGAVEFPCRKCGRLLAVGPDAIGKQARCPDCQDVQTVPNPDANYASPAPIGSAVAPEASATISESVSQANTAVSPTPSPQPATGTPSPMATGSDSAATADSLQTTSAPQVASASSSGLQAESPASPTGTSPMGTSPMGTSPMGTSPMGTGAAGTGAAGTGETPATTAETQQPLLRREHAATETPTRELFQRITHEIGKIYVGQDELVLGSLTALFSNGHVLIESVPGLGKTLFVRALGKVLGCSFGRIQFTADLMPSDVTGAPIFDMKTQEFRFRPGPIFTQLLLADEINRSPAKTHAALLEIMQEYRVTVDGTSHLLDRPFLVMATQNPVESEGTYNLPEAQLDRFMFKLVVEYPSELEEARILEQHSLQVDINEELDQKLEVVTSPAEIRNILKENSKVRVDQRLLDYINRIVRLTREWPQFHMGASPRAGIALMQAARTLAAFSGRDYAVPDDVARIALPALRHRVILTAEAEVEGNLVDQLLSDLIRSVEVPRL